MKIFKCLYSGDPPHPQVSAATQGARHHVAQLPLIDHPIASPRETFLIFLVSRVLLDICRVSANLSEYPPQCSNCSVFLLMRRRKTFRENPFTCKDSIFYCKAPIAIYTFNILLLKGNCDVVYVKRNCQINISPLLVNVFKIFN